MMLPEAEAEVLALVETGESQARKISTGYRMVRQKLAAWLAQQPR